jgi:endoglucanase
MVSGAKGSVMGVVGKKAVHLTTSEERKKAQRIDQMWLDIGARNKKEAEKKVAVGDPITYAVSYQKLMGGLAVSRAFDDKVGCFAVAEALRLASRRKLKAAVYAVSTVQEELGLRGARTSAFDVDPKVGVVVDVTFASDHPGMDHKRVGEIKLGSGPVVSVGANINPAVGKMLMGIAGEKKIPYQVEGAPRATGTDANPIQISRGGVATGLISVPNRYMHTPVEVISLKDLENTAKLLAEFICRVDDEMDFIP